MRLKLRAPNGTHVLTLADTSPVSSLLTEISTATSIPVPSLEIKAFFPPKPLDLFSHPDTPLCALPYKLQGEQLIISSASASSTPQTSGAGVTPPFSSTPPRSNIISTYTPQRAQNATGGSFNFSSATAPSASAPLSLSRKPNLPDPNDPPTIPLPSGRGTLTLRIMPDDNSCLFRALSHVLTHSLMSATELRQVVAESILSNPEMYSEAVLEQPPEKYCEWIKMETSWGGGIELSILAGYFGVEIVAIDVATGAMLTFGEGGVRRCIVVYSGIHYDAVAVVPRGLLLHESEEDEVVFESGDEEVVEAAKRLGEELRKKKYYTDTKNFELKCNTCGKGLRGEKGAVEHAKETGHTDFGEA